MFLLHDGRLSVGGSGGDGDSIDCCLFLGVGLLGSCFSLSVEFDTGLRNVLLLHDIRLFAEAFVVVVALFFSLAGYLIGSCF